MSAGIETLNHGHVPDFGFTFCQEEVTLGALPAMSIEQFATYACETAVKIIESDKISQSVKVRIAARLGWCAGRVLQSAIMKKQAKSPDFTEEELQKLNDRQTTFVRNMHPAFQDYKTNPFDFQQDKVIISHFYDLDPEEFIIFASVILSGGLGGWRSINPESVQKAVGKLNDNLKNYKS